MKILIRATNWVGDAIIAIPALQAARRRWPAAEIAILARPWVADLYHNQGLANRLIHFDSNGRHQGISGVERLVRQLRFDHFDVALLLQNAFQAAWIVWRVGIRERIGYSRDARAAFLSRAVKLPRHGEIPQHEAYYYLELLRRIGWIDQLPLLEPIRLKVDPASIELARLHITTEGARPGAPRIALAPGAAYGSAKCWPPQRFASLADRLIADFDADVILFGSASERDIANRIAAGMRHHPVNLVGQTPIGELPAFFAACNLFIGNDSGAMHVAAAAGIPVVAVFGPTDPEGTSPVTPSLSLVREPVSCSPCFLRHCPVDHRCMSRITVDAVYSSARQWMEGKRERTARG